MPRGKYVNHKGRGRSFTSPEELARELAEEKKKKLLKAARGEDEDSSDEDDDKAATATATATGKGDDGDESSSDESDSDEEGAKSGRTKGVEGLLVGQIENPNRRVVKQSKKITDTSIDVGSAAASDATPEGGAVGLSRREREVIEKQKAKERYQKLHAEGKTEEARKDLARLAIIRKQREEAAAKRLAEQQEKEQAKDVKRGETAKALGKK